MLTKILFIDRDGTLVIEPPIDKQLDSLEKLEFYPGVFNALSRIALELEYELVMVTNQDGLGSDSFPEATFKPAHDKIIQAFKNEGVLFSDIYIDTTLPEENQSTRKPGIGMMGKYIHGPYDLENSFVIGDRLTDVAFAKNLGCNAIYLNNNISEEATLSTSSWASIYGFLKNRPRIASIRRKTSETDINVTVNLDGSGIGNIKTGVGFFDHMLEQICKHGQIDLDIDVNGDLHIDEHHTIEDVAIAFGTAVQQALGQKKGVERYGFLLPMDDTLAQIAIDFGGRPWLVWDVIFKREMIGNMPTEMFMHFFKSFSDNARCNLNIKAEGENEHHKIEGIFKAFAKAIKMAISKNNHFSIPSTKGTL